MSNHFDMSATIAPKSDQLNADDLISGPRTITITRVSGNDNADQPVNVFFDGDNGKPFRPCKSMRRVMVAVWGANAQEYVGRSMTIYRDPAVQFGGMQVGGIRISHMSHIDQPVTMALTATRAKRAPYRVLPLADAPATPTMTAEDALDLAKAAAGKGSDHFRQWFNTDEGKACRATNALTKEALADLQAICARVDSERNADPFGLPPVPDHPSPEALAAAEAETLAALQREREGVTE